MSILTPSQLARVRRFEEGGSTGNTTTTQPYVSGVTKTETRIDPITQQLLFGLDGQGGFIPGAFRAAERTFFDEEGRPIVIPQEIAGFSPDQIRAMEMARSNVGVQQPFIDEAMRRGQEGIGSIQQGLADQAVASQQALQAQQEGSRFALDQRDRGLMESLRGTQEGRGRAIAAEERLRGDISDLSRRGIRDTQRFGMDLASARQQGRRSYDEFGRDITDSLGMGMISAEGLDRGLQRGEQIAAQAGDVQRQRLGMAELGLTGAASRLGRDLDRQVGAERELLGGFGENVGEARGQLRKTTGDFDVASATAKYQDPYEDQVVQQMIEDAREGLAKQDTAQLARDIQTGGQSAFGSRARLTGQERAEAMGRGLGKAVGELRSRGFQQAQQTAIGEDERQRQAQRAASSGLASLAGQELSGARGLVDRAQQAAQQRFGAAQNIAGSRQQRAASELAASRGLAGMLGQGAQQRYGAGQQVAGMAQQAAGQKLAAGQGYGNLLQQTAQAQLGAQQQLGGQLGQMAQQRYAAGTGLGQTLSGYGQQSAAARQAAGQTGMNVAGTLAGQYGQIGAQQAAGGQALGQAQTGYGGFLSGLGSQAQQAGAQDVAAMQGIGSMAQQNRQAQLDAQRAGLLQAQQAPLAQYQALMPFVNMAPAGQTQFQTNFGQAPSAMQAGLGTGLATVGALGNYYNPSSQLSGSR